MTGVLVCHRCRNPLSYGEYFHCRRCLDEMWAEDEARELAPELFAESERTPSPRRAPREE